MRLSVVIPSRLGAQQPDDPASPWFVQRAIDCVRGQTVLRQPGWSLQIVIGVDPGMAATARQRLDPTIDVAEGAVRRQADALNAALARVDGDVVALLEDDDLWAPHYIELAVSKFDQVDFVSTNQLERMVDGEVVGILDYPTPSSWVMKRAIADQVGGFDPEYRWHLDSEWLGRLGESGARRVHLVEATAPVEYEEAKHSRPMLRWLLEFCSGGLYLLRHDSPWPLVIRTRHPNSGMAQIRASETLKAASDAEYARMKERYGRIPW